MGFMRMQIVKECYLKIDGSNGTEIVPRMAVDLPANKLTSKKALKNFFGTDTIYNVDVKSGWIGRLSAPGYMDCTDWIEGETEQDVVAQLSDLYDVDENGDDLTIEDVWKRSEIKEVK